LYDVPAVWLAVHQYARGTNLYETGMPAFEQTDYGQGPVYGCLLFKKGTSWLHPTTVPLASTYQSSTFAEPGAVIRNVTRATNTQTYQAAFATFDPDDPNNPRGRTAQFAAYGFDQTAPVSWADVLTTDYIAQL